MRNLHLFGCYESIIKVMSYLEAHEGLPNEEHAAADGDIPVENVVTEQGITFGMRLGSARMHMAISREDCKI
jgi:hypothetical protein